MYNPFPTYSINPAAAFTYKDLQQLRERQKTNQIMCHYVIKFFECDHKTDDNVKGCSSWKKTGTHCDIDNPAVKKREDCSIRSENVTGLCPRCQSRERARLLREEEEERERIERERVRLLKEEEERERIERERARLLREEKEERERIEQEREEELLRRDLEKVRLADREEQRRNAEAHEAHIRQVQEESEVSWRTEYEHKKATELRTTTTRRVTATIRTTSTQNTMPALREPSPPPPPSPPPQPSPPRVSAPTFPPIDFSQPPKDQDYGHHFIGGRRQPVHPSQKLAAEHPLSPLKSAVSQKYIPKPTVRLAGSFITPPQSPPSSIGGVPSSSTGTRKGRIQPHPRSDPQEEQVDELQALWNRKGIIRETDEEEDGVTTASLSPSDSVSQVDGEKLWRRRGQN